MSAPARWAVWFVATTISFLVMETDELRKREPGKPSGTLSRQVRYVMGTLPEDKKRRRFATIPALFAGCTYLFFHFSFNKWNS